MNVLTPTSTLPKIITVLGVKDCGPCDPEPTGVCPHCGADGRYIYSFLCEDGTVRGAMKGCIQLFPRHPLAFKVQGVFKKQVDYAKKKWKLASWDSAVIEATGDLEARRISLAEWEGRVRNAFAQRDAYLARRFGR
jgi:hypothetical protein